MVMKIFSRQFPQLSSFSLKMNKFVAILCMLIIAATIVSAKPTNVKRQKRQSDQRLAELETLLALQKYNGHRVRGWQSHNDLPPGFGLIDFEKIGRRKKSTRFAPGYPDGNNVLPPSSWVSDMSNGRNLGQNLAEERK